MKTKYLKIIIPLLVFIIYSRFVSAQGYQVGSIASDFKLMDVSGKTVSLSDFKEAKGFIVVFTCNPCPFAKLYEERINQLNLQYQKVGYPVIAINPNDPGKSPEDSFESMKVRSKEKNFSFPYLYDEGQKITQLYRPSKTPHIFIVKKENSNLKVVYIGAIDDNSGDPEAVKVKYVEDAVNDLNRGRKIATPTTKAIGCTVKWKDS